MAKHAINHPNQFNAPYLAAYIGLTYAAVESLLTIACIIKLLQNDDILSTLNAYISYGVIAFVPNFAYAALPVGHQLKPVAPGLLKTRHRRTIKKRNSCGWIMRF